MCFFTSHVLFALEDDKSITAVRLALLVSLFMRMGVPDNADLQTYHQPLSAPVNGIEPLTRSISPNRENSRCRSSSVAS